MNAVQSLVYAWCLLFPTMEVVMELPFNVLNLHAAEYQDGQVAFTIFDQSHRVAVEKIVVVESEIVVQPAWAAINVGTRSTPVWQLVPAVPLRIRRDRLVVRAAPDRIVEFVAPTGDLGRFIPKGHPTLLDPSRVTGLAV